MIAIIDYGAGNLQSVKNALDFLGAESVITSLEQEILAADRIILPGVGAFGDAMESIRGRGLDKAVYAAVELGKPILGICLGLQLMFEESEEAPGVKGLGVFRGDVVKIPECGLKIPHIGWNSIEVKDGSRLFCGIGEEPFLYFVHSYYINASDADIVSAYTVYGERLGIAVERGNVFAVQFHPEKSGKTGLKILENFIAL